MSSRAAARADATKRCPNTRSRDAHSPAAPLAAERIRSWLGLWLSLQQSGVSRCLLLERLLESRRQSFEHFTSRLSMYVEDR